MFSVQLGSALSVGLIATVGAAGTAWLRLTMGALIFIVIARPPWRQVTRRDVPVLLGLGVATGLVTVLFLAAMARIPLGTAVAVEFLGPLTVAAARTHTRRALAWPALALVGVLLLTQPWHGLVKVPGLLCAALAASGWATYILLTQRIGDRYAGIGGLSLTIPIAAATAAVVGVPQAAGHITGGVLALALGLALLLPVIPFALEMHALRHMTPSAFGTLMPSSPPSAYSSDSSCSTRPHRHPSTPESPSSCWPGPQPNAEDDATRRPQSRPVPAQSLTCSADPTSGCRGEVSDAGFAR